MGHLCQLCLTEETEAQSDEQESVFEHQFWSLTVALPQQVARLGWLVQGEVYF